MSAIGKKVVSADVVGIIMNWAMLDAGKVTSLEVKNYLRTTGYYATQEIVSKLMSDVYNICTFAGMTADIDGKDMYISFRNVNINGAVFREYFLTEAKEVGDEESGEELEEGPDCAECSDHDDCWGTKTEKTEDVIAKAARELSEKVKATIVKANGSLKPAPVTQAATKPAVKPATIKVGSMSLKEAVHYKLRQGKKSAQVASELRAAGYTVTEMQVRGYKAALSR
jgi:hypothetical protein